MDGTAAERQRRYRARQKAHNAGDHSLCSDSRTCDAPTDAVTSPVTVVTRNEAELGPSGQRLWRELSGAVAVGGRRALIVEACRIADRLDKLDRLLTGDAADWLGVIEDRGNPERQEVVIDKPLAEARQQATALKQIVSELRQGAAADKPATGGSVLDQLAARRAARIANATG